jgi:hypothetical protein
MTWKPVSWRDVYPGQDWRFPDGETVHVGAIAWDGSERTALCSYPDGGVLHIPARSLFATAAYVGGGVQR